MTILLDNRLRSWGRNGYFHNHSANLREGSGLVIDDDAKTVLLDIDGTRSARGAAAPIQIAITVDDARRLAEELTALVEKLSPAEEPECDCADRSWYGDYHDSACPCEGERSSDANA